MSNDFFERALRPAASGGWAALHLLPTTEDMQEAAPEGVTRDAFDARTGPFDSRAALGSHLRVVWFQTGVGVRGIWRDGTHFFAAERHLTFGPVADVEQVACAAIEALATRRRVAHVRTPSTAHVNRQGAGAQRTLFQ